MTTDELIESCIEQNARFTSQVREVVEPLNKKQLNQPMSNGDWSIARVLKHMILANSRYLEIVPHLLESAQVGTPIVKHTWFGKALIKVAGPSGNASPPPAMVPDDLDYSKEILDSWIDDQDSVISLLQRASGKDTNRLRFKNPYIRLFSMNVTDCIVIITTHTDRHVRQILERARKVTESAQ